MAMNVGPARRRSGRDGRHQHDAVIDVMLVLLIMLIIRSRSSCPRLPEHCLWQFRRPPPRPCLSVVQVRCGLRRHDYWDGRPLLDRAHLEASQAGGRAQPEQPDPVTCGPQQARTSSSGRGLASAQKLA